MITLESNTHEAPDSFIGFANVLVLHKSIELLTGTIVGMAVLPHDGALSDRASLAEKLTELCFIDITGQVRDIEGLSINLVLLKELLVGVPGRRDRALLLIVGYNPILWVLLGNLKN